MARKKFKDERTLKKVLLTLLVAFAIVSFWRGAWGIMDIYLLPNDPISSFIVSILIGVLILYSTKNLIGRLV